MVIAVLVWVNVTPEFTVKLAKLVIPTAGPAVTLCAMTISSPATGKPAGDQVIAAHVPELAVVFTTPNA
jgi:hypothetical protein